MSDKIKVTMTAEQRVKLSKTVMMSIQDFAEYGNILEHETNSREIDKKINAIAARYGLDEANSQIDWDDMEETIFVVERDAK